MIKRALSLFLSIIVLFCLSSCGTDTTGNNEVETYPTIESTAATEPSTEMTKSDSFGLTLDSLAQVLEDSHVLEDFVTYETSQYTVHRTGYGTDGALLFSSPGSDKIEAALFLSYSGASRSSNDTEAAIYAQTLLCEYCEDNGIEYAAEEVEQEPYLVFAVYAFDSTLDNLPLSIRHLRSENEFFASEERVATFINLMSSCKYQELKDFIDKFISTGQSPEYDVAYNLVSKLDEIISLMDNCYVEVDSIEETSMIFYNNVNAITKSTNIVPVVKTNDYGASLDIELGFVRNDWIFFDEIYFSSNSTETEKCNFGDIFTDVMDGGNILESASVGSSAQNALSDICGKDGAVIRFKNSDTEDYIDHELTTDETEAFFKMQSIRNLHDEIWDSLRKWEDA